MPRWKTVKENGFERDVMEETPDEIAQKAGPKVADLLQALTEMQTRLVKLDPTFKPKYDLKKLFPG